MQGCGTDQLRKSHSVLPATAWLLHSPPSPKAPLCPSASPHQREGVPDVGASPAFSSPPRYAGIFLTLTQCLRSSASVQQVLCETSPIWRCILDEVRKVELHILLIFRHLDSPCNLI